MFHVNEETEGRRADMMKLIVAFRNFANTPKKKLHALLSHMQNTEIDCVTSSRNSTVSKL